MREVDEAVRTDEVTNAFRKYGVTAGVIIVLGLAGLAGYLYWQDQSESALEEQSETLIQAIDEFEAGNFQIADEELALLSETGSPGAMTSAQMLRAAAALAEGRQEDSLALYQRVVDNADAPQAMRDAANIRYVAANFDAMDKQEVITRLGPLANADSAWFGSAGELVAMAYLETGRDEDAGRLLVEIAKNEDVPATIRARSRQLAGFMGFDAIEDVEETLAEMRIDDESVAAAQ